uniref:Carboxylic ester hydrolase n=1 Tax=Angiostrongylus cantonensis TaxID=6313 RepID=A0A0K0DNG7_ANGCA
MGVTTSSSARSPLVKTLSGPVRGRQYTLSDGSSVDMYMGIPYAEPPIGKLRFKKPQPIKSWTEELDCVEFGPRCPQRDEYFAQVTEFSNGYVKEDNCLTLNIFTPRWRYDTEKKFPVMVWIHGGGFSIHSSSNYGDSTILFMNLCVKDVVVVSINYRLGPFGFFTTGDDACLEGCYLGNMGLWDQTLALHWIHDNIALFGGDPENVTVFGQSAGGASADLLSISPHSRDLFHRLIPMAGSGECEFAMRTNESQAKLCREFARFIGWTGNGKKDFLTGKHKSFASSISDVGRKKEKGNIFISGNNKKRRQVLSARIVEN